MKKFLCCVCFTLFFCASAFAQTSVAILGINVDPDIERRVTNNEVLELLGVIIGTATNVLPRGDYIIVTMQTVQGRGAEIAAACASMNCVVETVRKIESDYILYATLSSYNRNMLSLNMQIISAEFGNPVTTAKPLRSNNLRGILDQSEAFSADMFRVFLGERIHVPSAALAQPTQKPSFSLPPRVNFSMRYGGAALAVGGVFGGVVYSGMADKEYNRYKAAENTPDADARRKDVESHASTRNLFYILGGVGLSAVTVTLFF